MKAKIKKSMALMLTMAVVTMGNFQGVAAENEEVNDMTNEVINVRGNDNYIFQLDERITRKSVEYKNRYGIMISADLYLPENFNENYKYKAVLIGPPYGGVKEQGSGVWAQELAKRGYVALAFDPSYNGYSGGEERHISSPDIFVEDFSATVDYLGTRDFVDRDKIAAVGICGSGGFVLSAAQVDTRIKAVITASMVDVSSASDNMTSEEWYATLESINEQRYIDFENNHQALSERSNALQVDEAENPVVKEFSLFYSTMRGYHPNSICAFTVTSNMSFMNFSLLSHLDKISPRPILFIVGENALTSSFSESAYERAEDPKELYVVPNCNHIDLYDDTSKIPFDKIEEFLNSNLK